MRYKSNSTWLILYGGLIAFWILLVLASIPAWITHVITCINHDKILLLLIGIFVPPIGVIHGWVLWLGYTLF